LAGDPAGGEQLGLDNAACRDRTGGYRRGRAIIIGVVFAVDLFIAVRWGTLEAIIEKFGHRMNGVQLTLLIGIVGAWVFLTVCLGSAARMIWTQQGLATRAKDAVHQLAASQNNDTRVRVPVNSFSSRSCLSDRLNLRDGLKLNEVLVTVLRQPAYNTRIGKKFADVAFCHSQVQIVDAIGLLN
jgi:hypothetical protein